MLNVNGTICTTEEELEIAMEGLSDEQKFYLRNDFHGCENPKVPLSQLPQLAVEESVSKAVDFGVKCLREFSAENVLLGIRQQEGMSGAVLTKLTGVMQALLAGTLPEAIVRIRSLAPEDYDGTFISEVRVLRFINKIETYLEIPLSVEI